GLSGSGEFGPLLLSRYFGKRASYYCASSRVGLLELFFSLLPAMESLARTAFFRRIDHRRASSGFLSHCRLFRIAFSHGARRFHLLERRRRLLCGNLGCVTRHSDV